MRKYLVFRLYTKPRLTPGFFFAQLSTKALPFEEAIKKKHIERGG